jgi:transposase
MSSKTFRAYDQDQMLLMPPSVADWVPDGHPARVVSDLVDEALDLSRILGSYEGLRGYPPYDPRLLLKVLLFGYTKGVASSRRLADACIDSVAFKFLAAGQEPDFRTIAAFRQRHRGAVDDLFQQVLEICSGAGLVKLGHVSLDGTKIKANASMKRAMSYGRITKALLDEAERVDAEEDELYGDSTPYELPEHMHTKAGRLEAIRKAQKELERRAAERVSHRKVRDKDQYNFTDPDSRVMADAPSRGWVQGYNAQIGVDDSPHKIIVAADVSSQASDNPQLKSMVRQIRDRTGGFKKFSADAGYNAEANLDWLREEKIDAYVATSKRDEDFDEPAPRGRPPAGLTSKELMTRKLRTKKGKALYKRRKFTPEPVFGHIKHGRGMRQFLTRGLDNVQAEWKLICIGHNIGRLIASGYRVGPAPA